MTETALKREVLVILVDRANYGRLKPVMAAIRDEPRLNLQVCCAGTMVLERFDQPVNVVRADGFTVDSEIYMELEGSTPATMAKSVGFGVVEFASEFQRLNPHVLVVIGDRYEALAAVIAASFMNIPIVHIQGGEASGSIDESTRHAITKFSQYHLPATERAADFLVRMGERPETILGAGCPSSDLARGVANTLEWGVLNNRGSGAVLGPTEPFLLSVFHPTTTEFGSEASQVQALLEALDVVAQPTLLLWPNIDAGSNHISKVVRVFRDRRQPSWLRVVTNLSPQDYLTVLSKTACAVGNSSSFVRDAGFFGTPVVLVGDRQAGREHGEHVMPVGTATSEISEAIEAQLDHGRYPPITLYGDGRVSTRLASKLAQIPLFVQKRLGYLDG